MAACPQCGSRSIRLVINPLTWLAHLITERRASRCPRCGWRGWKHKKEWLHIPAAGILRGGSGHTGKTRVTRPASAGRAGDEVFKTVVRDGVAPPDLEAIDERMAESRHHHP